MTSACKISVIMPCFNHGKFLAEATASVIEMRRPDVELIVIDDGSTDEQTRQEMDKLEARGIKIIHQENKGLAGARNAGVLASQGPYIFPLDADDRMRPGWIDRAIQILDSNLRVGVVYGDAQCFGERLDRWITGPFVAARLLRCNYIHASALYRRSVWEQNRGYDGTMPVQGLEDWDFWLGALDHGWEFDYVPEIFFDYRIAKESMTTRAHGFEKQTGDFIAIKHAFLYRNAWLQLANQQESVKWTLRNLRILVKHRFRGRIDAMRVTLRTRIWHPLLNVSRPIRHTLGLRQRGAGER